MKTGISRYIIATAIALTLPGIAVAQRITESVTVEGRYTPDIIPADRLSLLPTVVSLKAPESILAYDRQGVTANFAPGALNMAPTGWRALKDYDKSRGYLDLRLGSWLNSSLSAGFAAINSRDTRLNFYLQHNSTSLWKAWQEDAAAGKPEANTRYRYDETLGADFSKCIANAGSLSLQAQYHLGYFNYYGTGNANVGEEEGGTPTQTLNDVYARVAWHGTPAGKFGYSAEADVRHFGYRSMYNLTLAIPEGYPWYSSMFVPSVTAYDEIAWKTVREKGARETVMNARGEVSYNITSPSRIDLGVRYSGVINSVGNGVNRVEILPAWNLSGSNWQLRLGANLAMVGNGDSTRFRAAPDVRFSARQGLSAFSASIGGGTHLRTQAWLHEMDYYSNPGYACHGAAYSPIDARLALQLNPGGKWTAGIEGEWCAMLDETFGGWYQDYLNTEFSWYESTIYNVYAESGHLHGFSIALNAGYDFCRYFAINAKGTWQPQSEKRGVLNGFDRPEFTADITATSRPTDRLSISLDYRLRAKRYLLPGNISRLNLGADYRITDKISVGVEVNNLLNRHEEMLPCLPMEGITAMGGVQIVF